MEKVVAARKDRTMRYKTDDELALLGWDWVARDATGKVAAITSKDDSDAKEQIMGWLADGHTVTQLFK